MNYKLAYSIGFHPWEDAAENTEFVDKISELIAREEEGRSRPYGTALDLGCGSGIWGIQLAKRGWKVTGVDLVPKALDRARERANEAGVAINFIQGDVTNLQASRLESGFDLILDTGTFHDFEAGEREAMGRGVDALAASDATLLLLAWPRRKRPLIRGVSRSEIEAAFPNWTVSDAGTSYFRLPKPLELLLRPEEHWYRLRRKNVARHERLSRQPAES